MRFAFMIATLAALAGPAIADGFVELGGDPFQVQQWGYDSNNQFWGAPRNAVSATAGSTGASSLISNAICTIGMTELTITVRDSVGTANANTITLYGSSSPSFVTFDTLVVTVDTLVCGAGAGGRLRACVSGRNTTSSMRLPWQVSVFPWEVAHSGLTIGIYTDRLQSNGKSWGASYIKWKVTFNADAKQVWARSVALYPFGRPTVVASPSGEQ
ncbi:MAG: hypothetical protein RI885_2257 [Actinomycetota bacterium]|jgi:hypothetical protein